MLYKRIIKTDIIKAIAEYTTEEYIKEYGIDKFMQMRDIFSECAAEVIFQWLIKQSTAKDEWEEEKHPRKANGQFGKGGSSSSLSAKSEGIKTIAGVKQGKPMDFQTAMKGVNPNYGKGRGYSENCSACTAVFIARMKGYDIEALPYKEKEKKYRVFSDFPNTAFIDPETGASPNFEDTNAKTAEELNKWLNVNIEQGGMYLFCYNPNEYSNKAHTIITFKNKKGELVFYDPQSSKFYFKDFTKKVKYYKLNLQTNEIEHTPPKVLRADNKNLDPQKFELFATKSKGN